MVPDETCEIDFEEQFLSTPGISKFHIITAGWTEKLKEIEALNWIDVR